MPMIRELYPDNWEGIARQIKDEAGWQCELGCWKIIQPGIES